MTPEELRREFNYQRSTFNNPWVVIVLIIAAAIVLGTWGV